MPWPTPQDYQEAVQNPRTAFADSDLQGGRPEENHLGFPRPISGGFATVYKVLASGRTWAVRCFKNDFKDQQQRYAAIGAQLKRSGLSFTVGFEFLSQGIRVRGNWYPVLKMEWVQGESLVQFVSRNLQSPQPLLTLGLELIQIARTLQTANIAHGDLQHGNILVVNGKPKLIDYDGMYVPSLHGLGSHEVGHPNYQHPGRRGMDFGPGLDNFSVWVIYLSLLALSVRPQLWNQFNGGDECLLFRRTDFERPDRSSLFRELENLPDPLLQSLAARFRSLLSRGPLQVPLIEVKPASPSNPSGSGAGIDWLKDHVRPPGNTVAATPAPLAGGRVPQPAAVLDASWILDTWQAQAQNLPTLTFQNSFVSERVLVLGTLCFLGLALMPVSTQSVPVIGWLVLALLCVLGNLGYWSHRYGEDGCVQQLDVLRGQLDNFNRKIHATQKEIADAEKGRDAEVQRLAKIEQQIRGEIARMPTEEQRKTDEAHQWAMTQLKEVARLCTDNSNEERHELLQLEQEVNRITTSFGRKIADLPQAERNELDNALKRRQEQHVRDRLRSAHLEYARINGIGDKLQARLISAGFRTAADIDWRIYDVPDIGYKRGRELDHWKQSIEREARGTAPTTLPPAEAAAIRLRYQDQARALQYQREKELQRLKDAEPGIRQKYREKAESLHRREIVINADLQKNLKGIRDQLANHRLKLDGDLNRVVQEQKTSTVVVDLNQSINEGKQRLAKLNWEKARVSKLVADSSARVTFSDYVARIFLLQ